MRKLERGVEHKGRQRVDEAAALGQRDGDVRRDPAPGAQHPRHPPADLTEQLVAVAVAEGVVDLLEAVEVEQQQRDGSPLGKGGVEVAVQQGAVGQPGEVVVRRRVLEPLPRPLRGEPAGHGLTGGRAVGDAGRPGGQAERGEHPRP